MSFRIPFSFGDIEIQKKKVANLAKKIRRTDKKTELSDYLKNAEVEISREEYLAICLKTFVTVFLFLSILFGLALFIRFRNNYWLWAIGISLLIATFITFSQLYYPKIYCLRKSKNIERNLIPALQDMLVQLDSGVPLFKILVNLAESEYGELSNDFSKAVKEINSGKPQIKAIDDLANKSSSAYFRRVLWQISNGMRSGSNMSIIIKYSIENLSKEQVIQIQDYGSKLNPLIMFYMLLTVIMPALGLTFLTIIASIINLPGTMIKAIFTMVFIVVMVMQTVFLGMIKTRRPSLL